MGRALRLSAGLGLPGGPRLRAGARRSGGLRVPIGLRILAAVSVIASLAGCGAAAADAGRSFGDNELINDIANRLTKADTQSYTATYALADNSTVSIAHEVDPDRTAYRYSGGMVLLTPETVTTCTLTPTATSSTGTVQTDKAVRPAGTCTEGAALPSGSLTTPIVDTTVEHAGLVRPETVIALLTHISANADAIISEDDRTLAGANATCISITGVPVDDQFRACVTDDGLLGAFHGTVSNTAIDIDLTHFELDTEPTAFALPTAP